MSSEVKYMHGQIVQKVTGDYTFIGTVVGLVQKISGEVRYSVEDGRGCVHIFHENQLAPFEGLRYQAADDIVAEIERIIVMNSSPTKAYGGHHDGQAGYILYERDGLPHVIPQLLRLFTAHDLVKAKDKRIAELQSMIDQEVVKRRAAETVLNEEVSKKRMAQDTLDTMRKNVEKDLSTATKRVLAAEEDARQARAERDRATEVAEIAGRRLLQYEKESSAKVAHFDPRKSVSNAQRYCSHEDETKLTDFRPKD